jgi:hypothetical protein
VHTVSDNRYESRFQRLADRLDAEAEKWVHEPGDKLLGDVLDVDTYVGDRGYEPCPMLTVEVAEGSTEEGGKPIRPGEERIFYASRTVARSEVEKASLAVGDTVGIKYQGLAAGKDYYGYKIRVLQSEAAGAKEEPSEAGEEPASDDKPNSGHSDEDEFGF